MLSFGVAIMMGVEEYSETPMHICQTT